MGATESLTQRAYEYMYHQVVNGEITVNDILSESKMAAELGMSKAPVREALVRLCHENILRSIPRMGYQVIQIMPDEVVELYETRLLLEKTLLKKTASVITPHQIQQLRQYNRHAKQNFVEIEKKPIERWNSNSGFHLLLASFGGNRYIYQMLEMTLRTTARAATQYFIDVSKGLYEDSKAQYHQQLIQALEDHDEEAALALIEKDVSSFFHYSLGGQPVAQAALLQQSTGA